MASHKGEKVLDRRTSTGLEHAVRALASAAKALRLYPSASPIPRENAVAAREALSRWFAAGAPVAAFAVAREGLIARGLPEDDVLPGSAELADALRGHGAAEFTIMSGCTVDDLLAALRLIITPADELRTQGGLSVALTAAGVEAVRVTDVQLTVLEGPSSERTDDVDAFIRTVASDPDRLSSWLAAASANDPAVLEEGLVEFERVAGPLGREAIASSLAHAFNTQTQAGKDAVLQLGMDSGPARGLIGEMLRFLPANEIAGSILGGVLGKNMLSLSAALTRLPLERVSAEVRRQVEQLLPSAGHTAQEAEFLRHMLQVRERRAPEVALVDLEPSYRAVAQAAELDGHVLEKAQSAARTAQATIRASSVRAMLLLLEQQRDFELYRSSVDTLASFVPRLIEQRDLALATRVVSTFAQHEAMAKHPWPMLTTALAEARAAAAGTETMRALLRVVMADTACMDAAREFVRAAGEHAVLSLASEAAAHKGPGLETAEALVGRRIVDALNDLAPGAPWYQLAPIAARLAREADARSTATLGALMSRPDAQSRRETATGLAIGGGPAACQLLVRALRDPSPEVQIVAVRAMVRHAIAGAGSALAARLSEIDIDNGDFAVGREIILALSKVPGQDALRALEKLASRRALIKRGRFSEVQELARQALAARQRGGQR